MTDKDVYIYIYISYLVDYCTKYSLVKCKRVHKNPTPACLCPCSGILSRTLLSTSPCSPLCCYLLLLLPCPPHFGIGMVVHSLYTTCYCYLTIYIIYILLGQLCCTVCSTQILCTSRSRSDIVVVILLMRKTLIIGNALSFKLTYFVG